MRRKVGLTLQRKNLLAWMHDGRVGGDRPTKDVVGICEVDDNDLILLAYFFPNANVAVRLERQGLSAPNARQRMRLEVMDVAAVAVTHLKRY